MYDTVRSQRQISNPFPKIVAGKVERFVPSKNRLKTISTLVLTSFDRRTKNIIYYYIDDSCRRVLTVNTLCNCAETILTCLHTTSHISGTRLIFYQKFWWNCQRIDALVVPAFSPYVCSMSCFLEARLFHHHHSDFPVVLLLDVGLSFFELLHRSFHTVPHTLLEQE
jgi:hypothetical protein